MWGNAIAVCLLFKDAIASMEYMINDKTMQKLTLDLPDVLFQQLTRIAELTAQPLESLALQSITGNLPPSVENLPVEMQAELSQMQLSNIRQLLEIAHSQVSETHKERHEVLLEKNQQSELSEKEYQELSDLAKNVDRLMLRKAHAWAILRWHGYPMPNLDELPIAA